MIVAIVIVALVVVLFFIWVSINNGIVQKNNKCDAAWQTIDAQLQRRNDLIPNLVETVKGYAAHESGTLEAVTAARNAVATATTPEAKMSYARQSYNDCVLSYNNAIQTFPGTLVAGSKYKPRTGFTVEDPAVRQAPQVKF